MVIIMTTLQHKHMVMDIILKEIIKKIQMKTGSHVLEMDTHTYIRTCVSIIVYLSIYIHTVGERAYV